jgi:uncharacterized protein YqgQ
MKSLFDIQQLLKRYGVFVYTGDKLSDLVLIEEELRELYNMQFIDVKQFQHALLLLKGEVAKEKKKNESSH